MEKPCEVNYVDFGRFDIKPQWAAVKFWFRRLFRAGHHKARCSFLFISSLLLNLKAAIFACCSSALFLPSRLALWFSVPIFEC